MDEDRIRLAEALLREAVFASRQRSSLPGGASASCGLGERAPTEFELTDQGSQIHARLFGPSPTVPDSKAIRAAVVDWIARQDALDRKRNHFLKDFRGKHGFDRGAYAPSILADFDAGLARINAEEDAARRAAAERIAG